MKRIEIDYRQFITDCNALAGYIKLSGNLYKDIYAVPRGGVPIAIALSANLGIPITGKISKGTLIVDDLIDSGKTLKDFDNDTAVLYRKEYSPKTTFYVREINGWIELPYEDTKKDEEDIIIRLLEVIGENPNREGLLETPKRVIKFYKQFLSPDEYNFTTFDSENYDQMIVQKNIPFFSLCEHHIAPFFGTATVAYIPNGKIVGLSKLTRCVEWYARKLQNQERITSQVAERLEKELSPKGVAVTVEARHFCMEMRGVRTHNVITKTTKLLGVFYDKPEVRQEYLNA